MTTVRRRCGYGLLYELPKSKKKSAPGDDYFLERIAHIDQAFTDDDINLQMAMGGAVVGIRTRHKTLYAAALKLAKAMGPIDFDPDGRCDPFDVVKNLTSDHVRQKLGV